MLTQIILAVLLLLFFRPLFAILKYLHYVYFQQIPSVKGIYGPPCFPLIGCMHKLPKKLEDVPDFMLKCGEEAAKEGASVMKFEIGPFLVVLPLDHEAVKVGFLIYSQTSI